MTQHTKRTEVDGMFPSTSKDRDNHQPASHRRLFTPIFLGALLVSIGFTTSPNAAKADIIYTWHEDDTQQGVSAQMDVLNTAQAAGQITLHDIQLFSFSAAGLNFNTTNPGISGNYPVPIDPATAAFSGPPPEFFGPVTATSESTFPNITVSPETSVI